MTNFRPDGPWRMPPLAGGAEARIVTVSDLACWLSLLALFALAAYVSVGAGWPTSIPVHHDDYTNYAAAASPFNWTAIRPLSTGIIYILSWAGPEWLIGAVRLLTVTYVWLIWKLLTVLDRPRLAAVTIVLYGACVFSSPISAEYARYTGMITHLISGGLGLLAVLLLFLAAAGRENGCLRFSAVAIILSVLAKEDFVVLYALSVVVAAMVSPQRARMILTYGVSAVVLCLVIVMGTKLFAASSFLGEATKDSSYYLSLEPGSVVNTLFAYLTGARHPAMRGHGLLLAWSSLFAALVALALLLRYKRFSWVGYFLCAALAVAFPYALLPNHTNAYYELIWLPFIVAALLCAFNECAALLVWGRLRHGHAGVGLAMFAVLALSLVWIDHAGRKSIGAWYEQIAAQNALLMERLRDSRTQREAENTICVTGATAFSPWYMHNGAYLDYVIGISATWRVEVAESSPLYPGFRLSAQNSSGRIVLVPPGDHAVIPCRRLDLGA